MATAEIFSTLMDSTPFTYITGRMSLVNDAISRNQIMPRFLRGRGEEEIFQGGPKIKDRMLLKINSKFRFYGPNDIHNYSIRQQGAEWQQGWAYATEEITWTEQELEHNVVPGMSTEGVKTVLKDVKNQKEQEVVTSIVEGLEDSLWAQPVAATMESPGAGDTRVAMSIPALINEHTNGLFPAVTGVTAAWTTKQNLTPSDYPNSAYVPQQLEYDPNALTATKTGLFAAFRRMKRRLQFKQPSIGQQHFEGNNYTRMFIACSEEGVVQYEEMLESLGDKLRTQTMARNDASYGDVQFYGFALEEVEALRDAELYLNQGGSALVSEQAATVAKSGPRYYWINTNYMKLIIHRGKWMERRAPKEPDRQIETWVQPIVMWYNLIATSMRRHGIISPSTYLSA